MIVLVKNLETEEKEAYFDIERVIAETVFQKLPMIILEGYDKNLNPRARILYKKSYTIEEIRRDALSIADEELIKEMLQEDEIIIHNCL